MRVLFAKFASRMQNRQPESNWRPSECEADVIATRPQVLLASSPLDPVLSFQIDLDSAEKPYPEALLHKN